MRVAGEHEVDVGTLREAELVGRMRKQDPHAPRITVFLDDIGSNLKTARALGMTTIKVVEPDAALAELEGVLGFPLRDLP